MEIPERGLKQSIKAAEMAMIGDFVVAVRATIPTNEGVKHAFTYTMKDDQSEHGWMLSASSTGSTFVLTELDVPMSIAIRHAIDVYAAQGYGAQIRGGLSYSEDLVDSEVAEVIREGEDS